MDKVTFGRKRKLDDCPNRLFLSYLQVWREEAKQKESKAYHTYNKAFKTLSKYPLPLQNGKEAMILENFGNKICSMLDAKLEKESQAKGLSPREYLEKSRDVSKNWWKTLGEFGKENKTKKSKPTKTKPATNRKPRTYIPAKNSGGYAILITLYKNNQLPNSNGYMKKAELQREAQPFSTKSFTVPDPGSQYTAWCSMSTLISKGLVKKYSNSPKYEITEAGEVLAEKLEFAKRQDSSFPTLTRINPSSSSVETGNLSQKKWMELSDSDEVDYDFPAAATNVVDLTLSSSDDDNEKLPNLSSKQNTTSGLVKLSAKSTQSKFSESVDLIKNASVPRLTSDGGLQCSSLDLNVIFASHSDSRSVTGDKIEFQLKPSQFEILLCVDSRELCGDSRKKEMKRELVKQNVPMVERVLQVGDFVWIAREKQLSSVHQTAKEVVLDYVVERKCMSDLAQSIRDGRFHEQKIRLKQCGVSNIIYLAEGRNEIQHQSLPEKTLRQALLNTEITDSIFVKYTQNIAASALYLSKMTTQLNRMYKDKTLKACDMQSVTNADSQNSSNYSKSECRLLTFGDFNDENMKCKGLNISQMFVRQLMQIHGMSCDKAQAITSVYPTPQLLLKAYECCPVHKSKVEMLSKIKTGLLQRNLGISLSRCVYHLFNT
ncbi:unnamed protein product [Clavelina lepadiformis]|uniref:Crossover junction endonuclease MUS81 n=1 Tax=Clavelina lepadiformis TaxID=159417 RepID=A0ABP0F7S3_CLALP